MALELKLQKEGETPRKMSLNLAKPARFSVELWWDSEHDIDVHALLGKNTGNGAKVDSADQILSTYNCKKTNSAGALSGNPDGSFQTPEGALHHSGDARTGVNKDIDEVITIDGSKVPAGVNEIPLFLTIHPTKTAKFNEVRRAGLRIKDDAGRTIAEYELSKQFGQFDAVQMGSFLLDQNGWNYVEAGVGFNGTFNDILGQFS
jgi:tellurium resistance protein TerD